MVQNAGATGKLAEGKNKMMNRKYRILAALVFPVACLMALTLYKHVKVNTGTTIVIPVTGYDPRDLLSGHYLTYRLDIKGGDLCGKNEGDDDTVYLCLEERNDGTVQGERISGPEEAGKKGCLSFIKGRCGGSGFVAGIERFYIPRKERPPAGQDNAQRQVQPCGEAGPSGQCSDKGHAHRREAMGGMRRGTGIVSVDVSSFDFFLTAYTLRGRTEVHESS